MPAFCQQSMRIAGMVVGRFRENAVPRILALGLARMGSKAGTTAVPSLHRLLGIISGSGLSKLPDVRYDIVGNRQSAEFKQRGTGTAHRGNDGCRIVLQSFPREHIFLSGENARLLHDGMDGFRGDEQIPCDRIISGELGFLEGDTMRMGVATTFRL